MTPKEREFKCLRRDYLERKIFLKHQLIQLTEKEIEAIQDELRKDKSGKMVVSPARA